MVLSSFEKYKKRKEFRPVLKQNVYQYYTHYLSSKYKLLLKIYFLKKSIVKLVLIFENH